VTTLQPLQQQLPQPRADLTASGAATCCTGAAGIVTTTAGAEMTAGATMATTTTTEALLPPHPLLLPLVRCPMPVRCRLVGRLQCMLIGMGHPAAARSQADVSACTISHATCQAVRQALSPALLYFTRRKNDVCAERCVHLDLIRQQRSCSCRRRSCLRRL
jgi:hypothetical protein